MNPWTWLRKILDSVERWARPMTARARAGRSTSRVDSLRPSRRQWLGQLKILPALGLVSLVPPSGG
jgi:hypothetical protein